MFIICYILLGVVLFMLNVKNVESVGLGLVLVVIYIILCVVIEYFVFIEFYGFEYYYIKVDLSFFRDVV